MFDTVTLDCDAVVYLDIKDELLRKHCQSRNVNFEDAKNMKAAIENDWNAHREKGGKVFYYLTINE